MSAGLPPLMLITNRAATRGRRLVEVVTAAVRGGARLIQIREKDLDEAELTRLADELREITHMHGASLLINHAVNVARAVNADGVVLPATSMALAQARALLTPKAIVARSTHSLEEITQAEGSNFVLFGPIFDTPSKAAFGPPQGLERLHEASRIGIPIYAVGGITARNAASVIEAGAVGIAVIREIMSADDPEAATRQLLSAISPKPKRAPTVS